MATYTPKRLAGPAQVGASDADVYTVGTGKTGIVKQIVFNNTTSSAVTVTANLKVTAGTSIAASNAFITALSIAPNSQVIWSADIPLAAGEVISLKASTGTAVTYLISGIEIA